MTSAASGLAESVAETWSSDSQPEPPRRGRGGQRRHSGSARRDRDGDGDLMGSAAEAASSAYRSAAEQADHAARRAAGLAGRARDQVADLAENYPLLLGAIGLAAGAAAGLALRPTESEDELIGSYSDSLKSRARALATEQYQEVVGAAQDLAEASRSHRRAEPRSRSRRRLGDRHRRRSPAADRPARDRHGRPESLRSAAAALRSSRRLLQPGTVGGRSMQLCGKLPDRDVEQRERRVPAPRRPPSRAARPCASRCPSERNRLGRAPARGPRREGNGWRLSRLRWLRAALVPGRPSALRERSICPPSQEPPRDLLAPSLASPADPRRRTRAFPPGNAGPGAREQMHCAAERFRFRRFTGVAAAPLTGSSGHRPTQQVEHRHESAGLAQAHRHPLRRGPRSEDRAPPRRHHPGDDLRHLRLRPAPLQRLHARA